MSAHYDLIPLGPIDDEWLQQFASKLGLVIPDDWQNSRNPTTAEVRAVVREMAEENQFTEPIEFRITGDDLEAILVADTDETWLAVEDYAKNSDENAPHRISFQYGEPELILPICERIARLCGPFLLTNNGAFFVIINVGTTPTNAEWVADDF